MLVTELGMVTLVRPEQLWNALCCMLVTEYSLPLYVTFSGMMISPEQLLCDATLTVIAELEVML